MSLRKSLFCLIFSLFSPFLAEKMVAQDSLAAARFFANGQILVGKSSLDSALSAYNAALDIYKKLGLRRHEAEVRSELAYVHHQLFDYKRAVEDYLSALRINEELGDEKGAADALIGLAVFYFDQKNFDKALEHGKKALLTHQKINDQPMVGYDLFNLAMFNDEAGQPDRALDFYFKAIENGTGDMAVIFNNVANTYKNKKDSRRALEFAQKALGNAQKSGDDGAVSLAFNTLSEIRLDMGQAEEAEKNARSGLHFAEKAESLDRLEEAELNLHEALLRQGKANEALIHFKNHIILRDSLQKATGQTEVMKRLLEFEFDKKEIERSTELRQQKLVRNLSIFGVLLTIPLIWFFRRNYRREKLSKTLIEAEKLKSDSLLLNILPAFAAEELKATGRSEARLFEQVTVLFSDFKEFTKVSEQVGPAELVKMIDHYFTAFDQIIEAHEIEKIKTIGDAYVAAVGLAEAHSPATAERMIRAAESIQAFCLAEKEAALAEKRPFFEARIGIHSGPVVAGVVGLKKFTYDIWGDTVNVAARMEASGEGGRINLSESTFGLVGERVPCEYRGKVLAKNKGEIAMYFVV